MDAADGREADVGDALVDADRGDGPSVESTDAPLDAGIDVRLDMSGSGCPAATLQCLTSPTRCDQARWGFEAGLDGWALLPSGDAVESQKAISPSNQQANSGSWSMSISVATPVLADGSFARISAGRVLCEPGVADLRGAKFSAAFRFVGPPIPMNSAGCFLNVKVPNSQGVQIRGGTNVAPTVTSVQATLFPEVGKWKTLVGYFPDDPTSQAEIRAPLSVEVECLFVSGFQWSGDIFVDDVAIE
jgi:hypothetical protein